MHTYMRTCIVYVYTGCFINCSSPFSVLKWNFLLNQQEACLHWKISWKRSYDWSLFWYWKSKNHLVCNEMIFVMRFNLITWVETLQNLWDWKFRFKGNASSCQNCWLYLSEVEKYLAKVMRQPLWQDMEVVKSNTCVNFFGLGWNL